MSMRVEPECGEDLTLQIPGNYSLRGTDAIGTKVIDGIQLKQRFSGVEKITDGMLGVWTINDVSIGPDGSSMKASIPPKRERHL